MGKFKSFRLAGERDLNEVFSIRKRRHLAIVTLFSIPITSLLIALFILLTRPGG